MALQKNNYVTKSSRNVMNIPKYWSIGFAQFVRHSWPSLYYFKEKYIKLYSYVPLHVVDLQAPLIH